MATDDGPKWPPARLQMYEAREAVQELRHACDRLLSELRRFGWFDQRDHDEFTHYLNRAQRETAMLAYELARRPKWEKQSDAPVPDDLKGDE